MVVAMVARRLCAHAREGPDVACLAELKAVGGFLERQDCGGRGMAEVGWGCGWRRAAAFGQWQHVGGAA
jgi:hypothetical protein